MTPALDRILFVYVVLVGAALGSFVNVVVARLPEGLSIVRPRSRCPRCGRQIRWYDNIPIVSYLVLGGRCRACKAPISVRYLLVEALVAGLCGALFVRFGWSYDLLVWVPLAAALVAITFLDIDHFWVPDVITLPAMVLVGAASFLPGGISPLSALIGLSPAVLLWAVGWGFEQVTGREGLGFGDVKLLALLGLALGTIDTLTALFLASLQGIVIGGVALLVARRHAGKADQPEAEVEVLPPRATSSAPNDVAMSDPAPDDGADDEWVPPPRAIPFGPFLVLGAFEVVLLPAALGALPLRLVNLLAGMVGR